MGVLRRLNVKVEREDNSLTDVRCARIIVRDTTVEVAPLLLALRYRRTFPGAVSVSSDRAGCSCTFI